MILVTGATGHVGNVLVRELVAQNAGQGETVRALVMPEESWAPLAGLPVELMIGNVLDIASLRRTFQGVRQVYHLAGMISIQPGHDSQVRRVNVDGTRNVLQAAREAGVERLVYTSSIHALKRLPPGQMVDETVPFDPEHAVGTYDQTKAEASMAVLQANSAGLDTVIVCPTGVLGPFDFRLSEMGRIILDSMRNGVQFCMEGAYDFVDVRDVAQGLVQACQRGRRGETYILSGEQIRLAQIMKTAQEFAGTQLHRITVPVWVGRVSAPLAQVYYRLTHSRPLFTSYAVETVAGNSLFSHAKACHELDYNPRALRETIRDAVQWFREHFAPADQPER